MTNASQLITYTELAELYGHKAANDLLLVIERDAARAEAGAKIIPFDRNARLQQAFAVWAAPIRAA